VNIYMNGFYIPYIYKPATSSHIKPRLLRWCLWLGFLLIHESLIQEIFMHCNLRTWTLTDSRIS
jgi:hypothetical protein